MVPIGSGSFAMRSGIKATYNWSQDLIVIPQGFKQLHYTENCSSQLDMGRGWLWLHEAGFGFMKPAF